MLNKNYLTGNTCMAMIVPIKASYNFTLYTGSFQFYNAERVTHVLMSHAQLFKYIIIASQLHCKTLQNVHLRDGQSELLEEMSYISEFRG